MIHKNEQAAVLEEQTTSIEVRKMRPDELEIAIDWATDQGWNPGLNDAETYYQADPDGFLVAVDQGRPIGACSAVAYGTEFGFIGLFIIESEYRHGGTAFLLLRRAMKHFEDRGVQNIGLDGVVHLREKYERLGFTAAHRNIRFQGRCTGKRTSGIVDLKYVPMGRIEQFDREYFPAPRAQFLEHWIEQPGAISLGFVRSGKLHGYGVMRPCHIGWKIGPLFADSDEVAEMLFSSFAQHSQTHPVTLDVPANNPGALALVRRFGMEDVFETVRMYNSGQPSIDMNGVYGITSFEMG